MESKPENMPRGDAQPLELNHLMAFNGFRGGNKGSVSSLPLSEYDKTIRYPWIHDMVSQIRGEQPLMGERHLGKNGKVTVEEPLSGTALQKAVARVKSQLPFRSAHYYHFVDNKRRQANIDPRSFLFQTTVDVDEKELVEKALARARELDTEEYLGGHGDEQGGGNPWKGMLLHLEYSARKKLHIDIRMPIGMTIEEAQRSYCEALGVPCDESCFSPERIIYITDVESELYRSPGWYAVLPDDELEVRREAFRKRGLDIDGRSFNPSSKSFNSSQNESQSLSSFPDSIRSSTQEQSAVGGIQVSSCTAPHPVDSHSSTGDGSAAPAAHRSADGGTQVASGASSPSQKNLTAPSQKNLVAFDLFRQRAGLSGVNIDSEGSRHSSLLAIMSAGASRVMGEEELKRVVAERMPSFSQERDCQQLIHDFYEKYADNTKAFSREVIRINAAAEKQSEEDYPDPPEMPERLPGLIKLLISRTPDIYKPAVASAVFPPLATHLWRTRFRYIDNREHEATLMNVLMAGTGAGKDCVSQPIDFIMADIRRKDAENLAREKAWKDEVTRKGANKDKRKRPEGLVIQEIDADMTNPAFVMRTAEAQEHFLYTKLNEIDQFDALRGQGNQQFRIMCLAFDPGNQYGQTRVGMQSVTERVTIRFNWNACTTIQKGQRYFARVLTDGPISRINFCTIPEREIGAEMPVYGEYGADFAEQLRPYIENLCKASGLVECREAFDLAVKLKEENADFARMSQDRIFENLSFRANVIGYLKACVLYVANGMVWEKEIEDFVRWSERYDLYCKMRFFGDAIAKANDEGVKSSKRGPSNMLQQLPDEFSFQEAEALRLQLGHSRKGTSHMLNVWVNRHYIKRKETGDTPQGCSALGNHDGGNLNGGKSEGENHSLSNLSFVKLKYRKDGSVIA